MNVILYLVLLIGFVQPFTTIGQDSVTPLNLNQQAEQAIQQQEWEQAIDLLKQAVQVHGQDNNWSAYFNAAVQQLTCYIQLQNYDKAIEQAKMYIQKAQQFSYNDIELSLLHKNLGKVYYIQSNYKAALSELEKAKNIREQINANDPELARDYGNLGILSRFAGRYNKAIELLDKAITLQQDEQVLARLYTEVGTNYKLIGNYHRSLDYQNQALRILANSTDTFAIAVALLEKGSTLTELKQEGEDIAWAQQALQLFQKPSLLDYVNQVNCYRQIAYAHLRAANSWNHGLDSARHYYQKALFLIQQQLSKEDPLLPKTLFDLATVASYQKEVQQASTLLKTAHSYSSIDLNHKGLESAEIFGIEANFYQLQGQYSKALHYHQKKLISLISNYSNQDIWTLPSIEQVQHSYSHNATSDVLAAKARCWYQYYKNEDSNLNYLEEALKTTRLFDGLIDHIRAAFSTSGSNIAWSDLTLDAYENAIEICLALAKETGKDQYKEQALYYSEKSKGLSLLESFQRTKAQEVAGLSAEELIQEREMKLDIADLEQTVFQLSQENNPNLTEKIKQLNKQIFLKKRTYQDFLKDLENNNPQYYQTKYQLNILDLKQIQALLKENQALIEYFVGDSSCYAFKITPSNLELIDLGKQANLSNSVLNFRNSIYGYFLSNPDKSIQLQSKFSTQYANSAYKLYQQLIEPLGELPQRLIIIPAGAICDMPFESLLMEKVTQPEQYNSHPFLVKKHSISYCYSATLLQEMIQQVHEPTQQTYVGFAPSFSKNTKTSPIRGKRFALAPLVFNEPEVENINKLLGSGTIFKNKDATEAQFKAIASDYKVIHFATHGMANSEHPDYSLLAFTEIKDQQENEFLYVSDLYNLRLNADMVVLSACETALGKHSRGEGILSLARGFSYAGAKSIFTTLWSVNDQSTFAIIKNYYAYLQEGNDKDIALQKAKLAYLENANGFTAHPFLWSPYITVGDNSPIPALIKKPWGQLASIGLGIIVLLGLIIGLSKRKG